MMKTITHLLTLVSDFTKSLFLPVASGYKLSSVGIIPDLHLLKDAHGELLRAYVEALAAVSRLSFLVGMNEVNPPKEGWLSTLIRIIFWGRFSPFRILVWRPVVKLYIDRHIYKKLEELKAIYRQSMFLLISDHQENSEYPTWLEKAKHDCEELQLTVVTRNVFLDIFKYFTFALVGLSVAIWGASNLYDLLIKIVSTPIPPPGAAILGRFIVFTIIVFPFLLAFLNFAFSAKRTIFMNINQSDTRTIYELENSLFTLLNRGKLREFPIDFSVATFFISVPIVFYWWVDLVFRRSIQSGNSVIFDTIWCVTLPFVAYLLTDAIFPWWKREISGEM